MAHVIDAYFDEIVQATAQSLRFDSSLKPAEGEYPFGKETADCLAHFLSLAKSFGFETHNYDHYIGEVIFGKGEDFAILAHLDVVPAGKGWKYPPFGAVINDEPSDGGVGGMKIWGRGAMDDKTPAIVCLYALKALKDSGFSPARTIKLIVGCNEESGWQCIQRYKQVALLPKEGFTPDANFPVIYAEKGILHLTFSFPIENAPFTALTAGSRANVVCDCAQATLQRKAGNALVGYENTFPDTHFSYDNTTNVLRVEGKSAHASCPQRGANALEALLAYLGTINDSCQKAYDILFQDSLRLTQMQDETGVLTLSPNVAVFENGMLNITTDIRFPATYKAENVFDTLNDAGVAYVVEHYQAPLYNAPDGALVSTLLNVYNRVTGSNASPIAIGGGTYARALESGCAFGPELCGEEDTIHQPNEYVTFERIRLMSHVYYEAIKAVAKPKTIRIGWVKRIRK